MIDHVLLVLHLAVCAPAPARDSIVTLPEVRVERARLGAARRRQPTAFVTELEAGGTGHALETLSEALAPAAGVRILQYGGLGAFSTVSLRGAPPGQVAIYLDGVPVTSAAHGVVNLADLPATAVERIEVYRGLAPLAFGPALPGGAINLVTVSSPDVRELRVSRGSFGTREGRASAGLRLGPVAGLFHAGLQASAGDFEFEDNNDTSLNPDDDVRSVRINNRFEALTGLGTVTVAGPAGFAARLRGDHFEKETGLPGRGADQAHDARLTFRRTLGQLAVTRAAGRAWPEFEANANLGREALGLEVHEFQLGMGKHDTDDRFDDGAVQLRLAWPRLPLGFGAEGGASRRGERATLRDPADGVADPPPSERTTNAAWVSLLARPLGAALTLHAAQRWDRVSDRLRWQTGFAPGKNDITRDFVTPQLGIEAHGPLGLEARANWTDARRVPEFMELFGNQGATQGNPALQPERAASWDAGLAWSSSARSRRRPFAGGFEWAHHASHVRDMIVFVRNSPNSSKAQNIARASIEGDELSAHAVGPAGLAATASFTWQRAVDVGAVPFWSGKRLPQHPARQWYARLDWDRGRLRASADALYVGADYLDRYNLQPVASRALFGASFSVLPSRRMRVTFEGKNLGNRLVQDVGGYPLPGRSLYVSCQLRTGDHPAP